MVRLHNAFIDIEVKEKGAEWCRFLDVQNNIEYLWSGDPAVWGKHAPLLFPIVGTLKDNQYYYNGNPYTLSRHGFARDMMFTLLESSDTHCIFELKASAETLQVYPFSFSLQVSYHLIGKTLELTYQVKNEGGEIMYYSIGGHPAFRVPFLPGTHYEDYQLIFEQPETVDRWPISSAGLIESESIPFLQNQSAIPVQRALFARDAIVLKHLHARSISLVARAGQTGIQFDFPDFPYLGLWAAKDADFLCIEPWQGIADSVNHDQQLTHKEGILSLPPDQTQCFRWRVTLLGGH
jgi:galactose mutarotase-like enzyme